MATEDRSAPKEDPVYGVFRSDCFSRGEFLSNENKCLEYTALKVIGYSIIVASFMTKIPQIAKILKNGSVEGLSRLSAYTELIAYFSTVAYARHLGLGLSVYGETILMSVQNFAVVLALYHYDTKVII